MEGGCLGLGVEFEINDHETVIADGMANCLGEHPRVPALLGKRHEGGGPCGQVGDRMLNV